MPFRLQMLALDSSHSLSYNSPDYSNFARKMLQPRSLTTGPPRTPGSTVRNDKDLCPALASRMTNTGSGIIVEISNLLAGSCYLGIFPDAMEDDGLGTLLLHLRG